MAGLLVLVFIGLALYGFCVQLPFYIDDVIHLRWLQHSSLVDALTTNGWLGYYRPVHNTAWKLLWLALGSPQAPIYHGINVALHILNAVLVFYLARLGPGPQNLRYCLAAGLLFLLFPFSYQAISWAAALPHPAVTACLLGSAVSYLVAQRRPSRPLKVLSISLALLAPFAHESGAIAGVLMTLVIWASEPQPAARDVLRRSAPYWVCSAIGAAAHLLLRQGAPASNILNLEARWQNFAYFLQGLAYPVSPLAKPLQGAGIGLNDLWSVVLVSLPALLALFVLLKIKGRGKPAAFAIGWYVILIAPSWLLLSFEYVIDGPRLMYSASAGAALLWALPVTLAWPSRPRLGPALARLFVAIIALGCMLFLLVRFDMLRQAGLAVSQLTRELACPGEGQTILDVGFPTFLAPQDTTYAVGHEGVPIVPNYFAVGDLYWANAGCEAKIDSLTVTDIQKEWRYLHPARGGIISSEGVQSRLREASRVIVSNYDRPDILVFDAGGLAAQDTPPSPTYIAAYHGKLALLSYELERATSQLRVTLRWQTWAPPPQETTVFLHLHNAAGDLVAQTDGLPVGNLSRLTFWEPGDVWRDTRVLPLPAGLAPGPYRLRVGAYPSAGGPRLAAVTPDGQRADNDSALIVEIHLP